MPSRNMPRSIASRTRMILASRGLSLSDVARASRTQFPDDSHFHVPPNLYHALDQRGFSPSLQQLFALSRLSAYRLRDWLAVFGVVLDDIPRLQATLPSRYTTLIDAYAGDERNWVLSFDQVSAGIPAGALRPLREWIRFGFRPASPKADAGPQFLYAKIGCRDALAFPDLLAGSVVRIETKYKPSSRPWVFGRQGTIFLIEDARGLACSKLHLVEKNRVVLCPSELAYAQVEFELGKEARILGAVDMELRLVGCIAPAKVPRDLAEFWIPEPLEKPSTGLPLHDLLRRARRRSGQTFREASAKTALIARTLQNEEFFCAAGSLSDYESNAESPRHLHKLLSLCTVYSLSPWDFMNAAGLRLADAGQNAMPEELLDRVVPSHVIPKDTREGARADPQGSTLAELPYFFGRAAAEFLKMEHLSIRDIFWIGQPRKSFHPYLADALAVIIDRHKKRVTVQPRIPLWAQPLYVLLGRDGQYTCTSCGSANEGLAMRPFSDGFDRPVRFKSPDEIEVAGKVIGILRRPLPVLVHADARRAL
jgi:hypothetical protein